VVNLRHIIITTDPNSQTSPNAILNRWRDKITIEIWNDTHIENPNGTNIFNNDQLHLHRLRQRTFYIKCLRTLKSLNKGWVLLIDTDEYVTINPKLMDPGQEEKYDLTLPSIHQPGSVFTFLQNLIMPNPLLRFYTPCIPIYRRQYSAQESLAEEVNAQMPSNFIGSNFATLRWRKWGSGKDKFQIASRQVCSYSRNAGPVKVLIDLARLRYQDLFHEDIKGNPHKPMESICPSNIYFNETDVGLIIHHYLGTLEQWMYRAADSRGAAFRMAKYDVMKNPIGMRESDTVRLWLKGFVESVGETEASRLLEGVGELEPLPKHEKPNRIESDPEPGVEVYKVGDFVQTKWEEQWYWSEVRVAGKYYNIIVLDDCFEMLGVNVNDMRRNGTVAGKDLSVLLGKGD